MTIFTREAIEAAQEVINSWAADEMDPTKVGNAECVLEAALTTLNREELIEKIVDALAGSYDPEGWRSEWFRQQAREIAAPAILKVLGLIEPTDASGSLTDSSYSDKTKGP